MNVPNDTIERAVKKGTGELEGVSYEEFTYEIFGPGGMAVLAEMVTDNKNRTISEIRSILNKYGGNLGASGSVSWMFNKRGVIVYAGEGLDEEEVTDAAVNAGAEDVRAEGDAVLVETDPKDFFDVLENLKATDLPEAVSAEVTMVPENTVTPPDDEARAAIKFIGILEDSDDAQNVYSNLEVDDALYDELD